MNPEILEKRKDFQYCIDDLIWALEHVDDKYVKWHMWENYGKITDAPNKQKEYNIIVSLKDSYCERVFAYELYHQFRNKMHDRKEYDNLLFNGEQRKDETFFRDLFKEIKDKEYVIPDLILHGDLGSKDNHDEQILYIEIKTKDNNDVYSDLKKLSDLTKTSLNFMFYIFVYVDGTIAELQEKVKGQRKENNYNELDDDVLCVCVKNKKANKISVKEIKDNINKEKQ